MRRSHASPLYIHYYIKPFAKLLHHIPNDLLKLTSIKLTRSAETQVSMLHSWNWDPHWPTERLLRLPTVKVLIKDVWIHWQLSFILICQMLRFEKHEICVDLGQQISLCCYVMHLILPTNNMFPALDASQQLIITDNEGLNSQTVSLSVSGKRNTTVQPHINHDGF